MSHKKPAAVIATGREKHCPVCGKRSYSSAGIHPQCAMRQADNAQKAILVAAKAACDAKAAALAALRASPAGKVSLPTVAT